MKHIVILFLGCLLCCCSKADANQSLEQAELDFQNGNVEKSRSTCHALSDSTATLTPSQWCRIALLYARIAESTDNQSDMAVAAECYNRACTLDIDSVESYIATLGVEEQSQARLLRDVSRALHQPDGETDWSASEPDSLAIQYDGCTE